MTRLPSKWTQMLSSFTYTGIAEVVMPSPFDQLSVDRRHLHPFAQRGGIDTVVGGDPNLWLAPVLGLAPGTG